MKKTIERKAPRRAATVPAKALVSVSGGVRDQNSPIDRGLEETREKPDMH